MHKQILLFLLINFSIILWPLSQNYSEFSGQELGVFALYAALVVAIESIVIYALGRLSRIYCGLSDMLRLLAGIFTALNAYSLIIIHNARFAALQPPIVIGIVVIIGLLASILYFAQNAIFQKFLRNFSIVFMIMMMFQFFAGSMRLDSLKGVPSHFKTPVFVKKPNIYLIGFDALSPEAVLKKNVGISSVTYDEEVIKSGGRIIPNAFAARIPTKYSLNSLLAMDLDYFDSLDKPNVMITEEVANPLYKIMRANGYKIGFLYETSYFGGDARNIDYYGIAETEGICKHIEKQAAFLGYCLPSMQGFVEGILASQKEAYPEFLFDRIKRIGESKTPWFTFAHIYVPGHSKNSFDPYKPEDFAEFKVQYEGRAKKATGYIHDLVKTIKQADPEAVLVIFGDHGGLTSNGLLDHDRGAIRKYALGLEPKLARDSPMSFKQIVQDRHGVFLALFPKSFCPDGFKQNPFATPRIMREVIKCLANGEDPLPVDFQPNDDKWKPYSYQ